MLHVRKCATGHGIAFRVRVKSLQFRVYREGVKARASTW